jgi:Uncharacterized conserved protein
MQRTKFFYFIAALLLIAVGIWLFWPAEEGLNPNQSAPKLGVPEVEPRFTAEGEFYFLDSTGQDTLIELAIELAERPDEIQYGMMYRKKMDPLTGMLFLMGQERPQSFYMKNTYVPLDIIYINDAMQVVSIIEQAEPLNEKSLPSEGPASLVLEVPGGFSAAHQIQKGQLVAWRRLESK